MKGLKSILNTCIYNKINSNILRKYKNQWFQCSNRHASCSPNLFSNFQNYGHLRRDSICILGIETSCDDTGAAVVNENGQILGEGFYSQVEATVKFGGVLPSVASKYHEDNIEKAVNDAFVQSSLVPEDLTAIAVTVKPGNLRTLRVGCNFGKNFALRYGLPLIPVHHMEAHALTVRMNHQVEFPFVVLLVSGGHCILAVAHSVDDWSTLANTTLAPGEALDKVARRMKLRNLPETYNMTGGKAIEHLAKRGNPLKYLFPQKASWGNHDTNFVFSAMMSYANELVERFEKEKGIEGGRVLDEEYVCDLCASFQYTLVKQIVRKTQRGLKFLEYTRRIPEKNRSLVISGGVASNQFLRRSFEILCNEEGYRLFIPPPNLCTDNGVMIAWNGIERWKAGKGILYNQDEIRAVKEDNQCPFGPDLSAEHTRFGLIKLPPLKIV